MGPSAANRHFIHVDQNKEWGISRKLVEKIELQHFSLDALRL